MSQESSSSFAVQTRDRQYAGLTKDLEGKWTGPFTFIQAADSQLGLIDRYIYKKEKITWDKELHYLHLVIQNINQLQPLPKFFVICGDLVDAFPHLSELRESQVKDLKRALGELNPQIKLVCVCGNHDVGDVPTEASIDSYKRDFGDDYFSFWCNGCKFVSLNSQLFFNSTEAGEAKREQDEWLDKELGNEIDNKSAKHLMVFQHIPLFVESADEPAHVYFNIEPVERQRLLTKFKKAGVSKVFCGHYHKNAGGFDGPDLEVVVTSAIGAQLGDDKHGFRLVEVGENEIKHRYIPVTDQVN